MRPSFTVIFSKVLGYLSAVLLLAAMTVLPHIIKADDLGTNTPALHESLDAFPIPEDWTGYYKMDAMWNIKPLTAMGDQPNSEASFTEFLVPVTTAKIHMAKNSNMEVLKHHHFVKKPDGKEYIMVPVPGL